MKRVHLLVYTVTAPTSKLEQILIIRHDESKN